MRKPDEEGCRRKSESAVQELTKRPVTDFRIKVIGEPIRTNTLFLSQEHPYLTLVAKREQFRRHLLPQLVRIL